MDFIDTLDDWLEDRWRALRRPLSRRERARRVQWGGVASLSLAVHMAVLFYFGSQLTDAYRLPEPPPEVIEPVEPVEAILVPPPEPLPPEPILTPDLRRIEPAPQPEPTPTPVPPAPVPTPTPPSPVPTPTPPRPAPAPPSPAPPAPAPPRPTPPLPFQNAPQTPTAVTAANRPVVRANPIVAPTLPDPAPPVVAPPAPRPAPPAPDPKKDEDDKDKPIARNAPPAAAPRQVAPNAAPLTVAPLQMAPTPRPASASGGLPGAGASNRPPPPGGANGDFTVRPSGQIGGGLRGALRQTVGCDNRNAVALNKGERNDCDETVGVRGANAPTMAVGTELSRDKQRRMQTQSEINEAMRTYKGGPATSGSTPQGQAAPAPRIRELVGGR